MNKSENKSESENVLSHPKEVSIMNKSENKSESENVLSHPKEVSIMNKSENKSESENVLSHPRDKKAEHDYLSDPELMAFDTCIGNLVRELRNAQRALKYLETINVDMHKLEGKVREVQEEHWKRLAKFRKSQHKDIP